MIFGKIDYINLLPFHVFVKKLSCKNSFKQSISYKKSYPSHLNKMLKKRKIDAAFISSIASANKNFKTINAGIVAKKEVKSVLGKKGTVYKEDPQSATSNLLAKILGINNEVLIGDKALKEYIKSPDDFVDLAALWTKKYKLPFVFARLSVNKDYKFYKKIGENFVKQKIFIPMYILNKYSKERGVLVEDIKWYLKLLSYKIDTKAFYGLNLFLRKSRIFRSQFNKIKELNAKD